MSGYQDPAAWNQAKDNLTYGKIADFARPDRYMVALPEIGYLGVTADESVDASYLKVTVRPENGEAYSKLVSPSDNRILLFDPYREEAGTVTVEVPGGAKVFDAQIAELQKRAFEQGAGQNVGTVHITAANLPTAEAVAVPTEGNPDAPGCLTVDEAYISGILAEYENEAGISGGTDSGIGSTESESGEKRSLLGFLTVLLGLGAVGGGIFWFTRRDKKKAQPAGASADQRGTGTPEIPADFTAPSGTVNFTPPQIPYPPPAPQKPASPAPRTATPKNAAPIPTMPKPTAGKFCTECGAPLKEGAKYCTECGKQCS